MRVAGLNLFIQANAGKCIGCRTCEIACSIAHSQNQPITVGAMQESVLPRRFVVKTAEITTTIQCRHCEDAPCANVCQVSAISRTEQGVLLNPERCIGCKLCIMACPFGAIELTPQDKKPYPIFGSKLREQSNAKTGNIVKANKCDLCYGRAAGPACVEACPQKALELINPQQEIKKRNIAAAHDLLEYVSDYDA